MMVWPEERPPIKPSSPSTTSSTTSELGRDRKITSVSAASSLREEAVRAAVSLKRRTASGFVSYTHTVYPLLNNCRHMGSPMFLRPTNPITVPLP